jgi:hypothetical protein
MLETLPKPEVIRQGMDHAQTTSVPALWLRWNHDSPTTAEKIWYLPKDLCLTGPAPERFGVMIQRRGDDSYELRVVWNEMSLAWHSLRRVQILSSALNPLLRALGKDLWQMLVQPVHQEQSLLAMVA